MYHEFDLSGVTDREFRLISLTLDAYRLRNKSGIGGERGLYLVYNQDEGMVFIRDDQGNSAFVEDTDVEDGALVDFYECNECGNWGSVNTYFSRAHRCCLDSLPPNRMLKL